MRSPRYAFKNIYLTTISWVSVVILGPYECKRTSLDKTQGPLERWCTFEATEAIEQYVKSTY